MSGQELLIILLVGLIAGWLAGQIMQGTGYGIIADIALGVVGALIGSWLLPQLGIHLGFVISMATRPDDARALADEALVFIRPFDDL